MLIGCHNDKLYIYDNLNAEETYNKALLYFEEEVNYYRADSIMTSIGGSEAVYEIERFFDGEYVNEIRKQKVEKGILIIPITVFYNGKIYQLIVTNNDVYKLFIEPAENKTFRYYIIEEFPNLENLDYEIERKEVDNEIILTITYRDEDDLKYEYIYTIGKNGLIYCVDININNIEKIIHFEYSEFNRKTSLDFEGIINNMKEYEGNSSKADIEF